MGGVENHVFHLAKQIAGAGNRATVIALSESESDQYEDGVRVVRLRKHFPVAGVISFPAVGAAKRISKLTQDLGVDVVSTHTRFFPMSVVGARVAKRLGTPVIHTEHGSDFVRSASFVVSIASRLVDLTLGRWVLRNAEVVLGVSEQVTSFVRKLAGVTGVVFYNAIDLTEWSVEATKKQVAVPRFVFLGRLVAGKGWDDLLDSVAVLEAAENVSPFEVDIMGDGPDRSRLEARISELRMGERVHVLGQVSPDIVRERLTGAILVNPTVLSEGFQTTLLEAIAVGGRIISYPVPGLDQLIADGAPIDKVRSKDVPALAHAMGQVLSRDGSALDSTLLAKWSWDERGREYLDVVAGLHAKAKKTRLA
jgi:glycosyltransferase involved in cell wall biosynthesis